MVRRGEDVDAVIEAMHDGREERPIQELFYEVKPPTILLSSPVVLDKGGQEYVAAVAGAELSADLLRSSFMEATKSSGSDEYSCAADGHVLCYLLDSTAHVLASNQNPPFVEAGDYLGEVDPQLMRELSASIYEPFVSVDYQALCPDDLDCCTASDAVKFASPLALLRRLFFEALAWLGILGHAIMATLLPTTTSAVSEYGFVMPEGLHRCATNTTYWGMRKNAPSAQHRTLVSKCGAGSGECRRDYHVYALSRINAALAVVDPKCGGCFEAPYKDGPVEDLRFREKCRLPERMRQRPEECFAVSDKERPECSSAGGISPFWLLTSILALMTSTT